MSTDKQMIRVGTERPNALMFTGGVGALSANHGRPADIRQVWNENIYGPGFGQPANRSAYRFRSLPQHLGGSGLAWRCKQIVGAGENDIKRIGIRTAAVA